MPESGCQFHPLTPRFHCDDCTGRTELKEKLEQAISTIDAMTPESLAEFYRKQGRTEAFLSAVDSAVKEFKEKWSDALNERDRFAHDGKEHLSKLTYAKEQHRASEAQAHRTIGVINDELNKQRETVSFGESLKLSLDEALDRYNKGEISRGDFKAVINEKVVNAERANAVLRNVGRARNAVVAWMNEEGAVGHLRVNSQAPGWPAYEKAETALWELIGSFMRKEYDDDISKRGPNSL